MDFMSRDGHVTLQTVFLGMYGSSTLSLSIYSCLYQAFLLLIIFLGKGSRGRPGDEASNMVC